MRVRWLAIAAVIALVVGACGDSDGSDSADGPPATAVPNAPSGPPELLFSSGFGEGTTVDEELADLHGVDQDTGFDWDENLPWADRSEFYYAVRDHNDVRDFMNTEIIEDVGPTGDTTRMLHLESFGNDDDQPSTSRNEYSFFSKDAPDDLKEGYVRYWTKLQPDLDTVVPAGDESRLYYLMETKDRDLGSQGSDEGFSSFRTNVGIARDADGELYWVATGEQVQPERQIMWQSRNDTVDVPLGEWFLVEAYMKRGSVDGRLYFAVDGEIVFDITGQMSHADDPQPHLFWSIFKLYHDTSWWASGPTEQWYDDVEMWSTFPPDVTTPPWVQP